VLIARASDTSGPFACDRPPLEFEAELAKSIESPTITLADLLYAKR
jgi:hypothetical protein